MQPKVSIIVAVYKAEAYLRKCVDSLLAQTLREIEVVLVDDGSPDASGALCDAYAVSDPRVRVIHQPNRGVSAARQAGVDAATGEYSIHCDPDDYVDPAMLSDLYAAAQREGADMVVCDYYREDAAGQRERVPQRPAALDHITMLRQLILCGYGSLVNKLVRHSLYRERGVRFPEGIDFNEDGIVVMRLLLQPLRLAYVDAAYYHYIRYTNANSLTATRSLSRDEAVIPIYMRELPAALRKSVFAQLSYNFVRTALAAESCPVAIFRKRYGRYGKALWGVRERCLAARFLLWAAACVNYRWVRAACRAIGRAL